MQDKCVATTDDRNKKISHKIDLLKPRFLKGASNIDRLIRYKDSRDGHHVQGEETLV